MATTVTALGHIIGGAFEGCYVWKWDTGSYLVVGSNGELQNAGSYKVGFLQDFDDFDSFRMFLRKNTKCELTVNTVSQVVELGSHDDPSRKAQAFLTGAFWGGAVLGAAASMACHGKSTVAVALKDGKQLVIDCYSNVDALQFRSELFVLQTQPTTQPALSQNDNVSHNRLSAAESGETVAKKARAIPSGATPESLLKRAFIFLEDGDFDSADEYCEAVLDIDPECAEAYVGKLMVDLHIHKQEELAKYDKNFGGNANYKKALRFGDDKLKAELSGYVETIVQRNEQYENLGDTYRYFRKLTDADNCEIDASNTLTSCDEGGSIELPDGIKKIGTRCFFNSNEVIAVKIPEGVEEIDYGAFANCQNLESVSLPSTLKKIGEMAFGLCKALKQLDIPAGVTEISNGAFLLCDNLTIVPPADSVASGIALSSSKGAPASTSCEFSNSVTENEGYTSFNSSEQNYQGQEANRTKDAISEEPVENKRNTLGILSIIFGAVGIFFAAVAYPVNFLFLPPAIVFTILGLVKIKRGIAPAIIGAVITQISLIVSLLVASIN